MEIAQNTSASSHSADKNSFSKDSVDRKESKSDEVKESNKDKSLRLFAKKPRQANHQKPLTLVSNFQRIHTDKNKDIIKYSTIIEPSISSNGKLFGAIMKGVKDQLGNQFKFTIDFAQHIYAYEKVSDELNYKTEVDGTEYTMKVRFAKVLDKNDPEQNTFFSIFFKTMMRRLTFEQVGRNCFMPKKRVVVNKDIEIWPGFYSSLNQYEEGILLQLDLASRVVRTGSKVLDHINELLNKHGGDRELVAEQVKGMPIVTSYAKGGKHTYRVENIDFTKNIEDEFETKTGKISFKDYYMKNYNIKIYESSQPLLMVKDQKTDKEMYFIPEICEMTGLTDAQRADFRLMKQMSEHLHKPPQERVRLAEQLISDMESQTKVKEHMEKWNMKFEKKALELKGQHIDSGKIIMNNRVQPFQADGDSRDFDRKIQDKMKHESSLKQWCIIHSDRTTKEANTFKQTIGQCIQQFKYDAQQPALFCINGRDNQFANWEKVMKEKLNPKVSMVVFILSGPKKKGACYNEIKQMIYQTMPVPCQCILGSTLNGKNLRSICNKILIQMNAKMSGIPWAIDGMPFTDKPTTVIGYSSVKKSGGKHVFGLCATTDRDFARYFCSSRLQSDEIATCLQTMFDEAFQSFKKKSNCYPKQVVVYRDGISDGQKLSMFEQEVDQIKKAIASIDEMKDNTKLVFITVNKRIKTKFVMKDRERYQVPLPGTVVDTAIVAKDLYDFFLCSTICRQGVPTPSHYSVLVDEINQGPEAIQKLTYKLCYLYYNTSGPIKIPCPVKYAFLLATRVSEQKLMSNKPGDALIHPHYIKNTNSLFHI